MRLGYSLDLEQTQQLIMTPQLKQAIKILQLPTFELNQYIQEQVETNPILDLHNEGLEVRQDERESEEEKIDWEEYAENFESRRYTGGSYNPSDDFNYENLVATETTLQEHLLFQYNISLPNPKYKIIGEYIINNLDENGYLTLSVEEISKELGKNIELVERILEIIQTFDPAGVAARSLKECLLIQLKQTPDINNNIYILVEKYLEDLADNKFPYIAKEMGVTPGEVQKMSDFIRTLEPKPGRRYTLSSNNYIIPDATIRKLDNEYLVILNESNGPRLRIREDYRRLLASGKDDSDACKFLNDKLNSAVWLIRSIEQRKHTIYRVVETIIKKQKTFFEQGKKHLKPMTLKEVADEIEVHESTVSRATNGKYIDTPLGIFELKHFFSSGVEDTDGKGISAQSIKKYIKEIINNEDPYKPLSDERICRRLNDKGINISRRTVAKYRNDLNIVSSSRRKRY